MARAYCWTDCALAGRASYHRGYRLILFRYCESYGSGGGWRVWGNSYRSLARPVDGLHPVHSSFVRGKGLKYGWINPGGGFVFFGVARLPGCAISGGRRDRRDAFDGPSAHLGIAGCLSSPWFVSRRHVHDHNDSADHVAARYRGRLRPDLVRGVSCSCRRNGTNHAAGWVQFIRSGILDGRAHWPDCPLCISIFHDHHDGHSFDRHISRDCAFLRRQLSAQRGLNLWQRLEGSGLMNKSDRQPRPWLWH